MCKFSKTYFRDMPYRTKKCRTKVTKFFGSDKNMSDEKFSPTKILSNEIFCQIKFLPKMLCADAFIDVMCNKNELWTK